MRTSIALRRAVDQFLAIDSSQLGKETYLCWVLQKSEISVEMQQKIISVFIKPDEKSSKHGLYKTPSSGLTEKGAFNRQCTRFMLAEFIACYYESIGD